MRASWRDALPYGAYGHGHRGYHCATHSAMLISAIRANASRLRRGLSARADAMQDERTIRKFREFTMIPPSTLLGTLELCRQRAPAGCIVECGVWRGGMSGALADTLPGRQHHLFDSFQGLPPAMEIDGPAALAWQADKSNPGYFDNCRAEQEWAQRAMEMSAAASFEMHPGWFDDTLPVFSPSEPIAVLHLDGDWYASVLTCLTHCYPLVAQGGLIVVDDYHTWDGCARAVHDYLSINKLTARISQTRSGGCYLVKLEGSRDGTLK